MAPVCIRLSSQTTAAFTGNASSVCKANAANGEDAAVQNACSQPRERGSMLGVGVHSVLGAGYGTT